MSRPGNSTEVPVDRVVVIADDNSGYLLRLCSARSVSARFRHSDKEVILCGLSSMAMSCAMRSTATLHNPKTTAYAYETPAYPEVATMSPDFCGTMMRAACHAA